MAAAEQSQAALQFPWQMFFRYVYAAKFLCGEFKPTGREGPVQPGRYSTAINVHNPHGFAVAIRKKAILLFNGEHPEEAVERPVPPTHGERTVIKELGPDWGLEIDCLDIRDLLLRDTSGKPGPQPPIFIKGWVVIETVSDAPVDVVAVYTAEPLGPATGAGQSISIETDRVPGTRTFLPGF
jgi:hypothetical protein